jgi:transcriptional regulator with XRE-family HTH domain
MNPLSKIIRSLREKHDLSQAAVAMQLDLSRPTYVQIEKGERELSLADAQKIAELYGLSLSDLIAGREEAEPVVTIKGNSTSAPSGKRKAGLRISVPQSHLNKFKEVFLYILEKVGSRPNVGQVVLYKLLYFIDFDHYEKFEEQLIGATYIKNHFGPTPVEFKKLLDQMTTKGDVEEVKSSFFKYQQTKYLPRRGADLAQLSAQEIQTIDDVIAKYGHRSAKELSEITHRDVPWITAQDQRPIDYESVFYRTPEFSVRAYGSEDA